MARDRKPERDKARQIWLESGGKMTAREVAEAVGVKPDQVRKWKSLDKWQDALAEYKPKKKRGGQPGNKNAAGAGAPEGNKNAETHGAYSAVRLADLPPEQREYIEKLTLDTETNMLAELQALIAKENDLHNKIAELERGDRDALFVDRVIKTDGAKGTTTTEINASAFDRMMKLEGEANRIHGRIIKLLDSIKGYELECRRVRLEERKFNVAKQKLAGAFDVNPDTGEIIDDNDSDGDDLDL